MRGAEDHRTATQLRGIGYPAAANSDQISVPLPARTGGTLCAKPVNNPLSQRAGPHLVIAVRVPNKVCQVVHVRNTAHAGGLLRFEGFPHLTFTRLSLLLPAIQRQIQPLNLRIPLRQLFVELVALSLYFGKGVEYSIVLLDQLVDSCVTLRQEALGVG